MEVYPLNPLLALNTQQCHSRGLHIQLLLLHGAEIAATHAVTRLRQCECAFAVREDLVQSAFTIGERLGRGERALHIAQRLQGEAGVFSNRLLCSSVRIRIFVCNAPPW